MAFWSRLFGRASAPAAMADPTSNSFTGLTDPRFLEFIRSGGAGPRKALQVSAVFRSITLISGALAMLPMRVMAQEPDGSAGVEAVDHPLFNLLSEEPNARQTAFEFKRLMEMRRMVKGNAYARIIRSGPRIAALVPLDPDWTEPNEHRDGTLTYSVKGSKGSLELPASDVLHLRGFTLDGVKGVSILKMASEAIGLSQDAAESLARIYKTGVSAGGALSTDERLSPEAKQNLRESLETFRGPSASGKWMVLDEGMKATLFSSTARDNQTIETLRHQVEDIARFFGVPRPLLGLDDTSWGSGVEQLAILFVRFGLSPSLVEWEQAFKRVLLSREEKRRFAIDIDERELLRGSMKDQSEFFARAMGAGGGRGWMTANEIRDLSGLRRHPDGDVLPVGSNTAPAQGATQKV